MATSDDGEQSASADGRFGVYEADDGRIVVYDEELPEAWIRSDTSVQLSR